MQPTIETVIKRRRRRQGGMTLLEIMIVLAILALVMGFLVGPRVYKALQDSKEDSQKAILSQWVEGYGMWANRPSNANNPCPQPMTAQNIASVLKEYVNNASPTDKWGHELVFYCGATVPAGVHTGFAVKSLGPDGADAATGGDDLRSWE
jgi:general secretion pathway protein G